MAGDHTRIFAMLIKIRLVRTLALYLSLPCLLYLDLKKTLTQAYKRNRITRDASFNASIIDDRSFPDVAEFERTLYMTCSSGARTTGGTVHEAFLDWLRIELEGIGGLGVRVQRFDILKWETVSGIPLKEAGSLVVDGVDINIAGAVPFSKPGTGMTGELHHLGADREIGSEHVGRLVIRDLKSLAVPYPWLLAGAHHKTPDLHRDLLKDYDRLTATAGHVMARDLAAGGQHGVAGIVFTMNVPTSQIESYFEPHDGTHWRVPAVLLGQVEAEALRSHANRSQADDGVPAAQGHISIRATISPSTSANITAVLPGKTEERVVYVTHTDGNTYVQENGPVALLALARYFSQTPLDHRNRTLEFVFNSAHLHMSREASVALSRDLNDRYEGDRDLALVVALEHLGAREIEAVEDFTTSPSGGRRLRFTGRPELASWCVGPMPIVQEHAWLAVQRRGLERTVVAPGVGLAIPSSVPEYRSFGGIGTSFHQQLLPTTSLISGPWSLWAPGFGRDAVDVDHMRRQTLALGDVYLALEPYARSEIVGGYEEYRRRKAEGRTHYVESIRPEVDE